MTTPYILIGLLVSGVAWGGSFKEEQLKFPRVREAYATKEAQVRKLFAQKDIPYPPAAILLRAFKREGKLELWAAPQINAKYVKIKDYDICRSSGSLGPKRQQGDGQVPEGFYEITRFNPNSQFHLSLLVNYPNASDKILSDRQNPGDDIFIHGNCVTIGCLPLTDNWIQELYVIATDVKDKSEEPIRVYLFPTALTVEGLKSLKGPHLEFWKNLQPGYLYFENEKRAPTIRVDSQGKYLW